MKRKFTLIELLTVMILLSIMVTGSVYIVADLINGAIAVETIAQDDLDQNYTLLRLQKELSIYNPNVSIPAGSDNSFTINNAFSNISTVTWDQQNQQLLYDGNVAIDHVNYFKVSKNGSILTVELGMNGSEIASTRILLRE